MKYVLLRRTRIEPRTPLQMVVHEGLNYFIGIILKDI